MKHAEPAFNPLNRYLARPAQTGVGLLEVLISLVIAAIGLLGMAALHGKAHKAEMESYQRSQALILLQDMAGRLRANRSERAYYVDGGTCPTSPSTCSNDKSQWRSAIQGNLLNGEGCISGSGNAFVITIAWQGLADIAVPSTTNTCGGTLSNRRLLSVPVRFFDPGG
jgi:type IV pilus assembly protein PilV